MENVLAAFIIIFLILFGMLTLSETVLSSQIQVQESWQEIQTLRDDQARTSLLPLEAHTTNMGTVAVLTLRNSGAQPLTRFEDWDAILDYYDAGAAYRTSWLPYTAQNPIGGDWTVAGIYANDGTPEVFDPGILDPGEIVRLNLKGSSPIGAGADAQAVIVTENGVRTSWIFKGNCLPLLVTNTGIIIAAGETVILTSNHLQATDEDDVAESLVYTITTPPAHGSLSFDTTFTQADVNDGLLSYTGTDSDTFQFTVSDGKDSIGPYSFTFMVNAVPVLEVNTGITLLAEVSAAAFSSDDLQATDAETSSDSLIYTITRAPQQGTLSFDTTFTQDTIDQGQLIYSHTGTGSDSFEITISDGKTSIGPYTVSITVP
jgi:hypothetical protein